MERDNLSSRRRSVRAGAATELTPALVAWLSADVMPYEPQVRAWLSQAGVSAAAADDIVQEAYSRIVRQLDVAPINSGRGYFFTVARNILFEQLRRERLVRIDSVVEIDSLNIIDDMALPERVVAARQQLARVARLIGKLPERCRRILLLRRVEGMSQREVARVVGVTENVVEKDVALGVRRILEMLSAEHTDDRKE